VLLLRLAWRNIGRGWRRSAVVLAAVAVGLSACLVLIGWMKGMTYQMADNAIRTQLAHVAVQRVGYQQNPDVQRNLGVDAQRIVSLAESLDGVHAAARLRGEGLIQSARRSLRVVAIGADPVREGRVSVVPHALVEGSFLAAEDRGRRRRLPSLVIGAEMAERLRVGLGDKLVVQVPGEAGLGAFRVRGIYRTSSSEYDRTVAYMRLDVAARLFAVEGPTEVALSLDDPDEALAIQAGLVARTTELFGAGQLEVLRWQERQPRLASLLDITANVYWIFYAVIFVAMAFGIANALLMAVYERMREFGVLRSLGLKSRRLVALVLLESVLLTLLGTALGLGIGLPLVLWLGRVGIDMAQFATALEQYGIGTVIYLRIDSGDIIIPVALAIVTALLAALWPALKAARLRPAEALRAV
jgi:ABC-type lipoprotein release transport system permease subunit